jgi:death-on-curing protein
VSPTFLELAHIVEIHRDQVARYGGSPGIRDRGLLESAVAMPQSGMGGEYFHRDLYEMAAAYLFHIVKNHPFVDGNKRVGALAAFVFLRMNGVDVTATESSFERLVLAVVTGAADKAKIARFLREHSRAARRR